MKWTILVLLMFATTSLWAQDPSESDQVDQQADANQFEINQQDDKFSEVEVGKALETTESTLDQIGREIASEAEIEVVE